MCTMCFNLKGYGKDGKKLSQTPGFDALQEITNELIELHKVKIENNALVGQNWRADIDRLAGEKKFSKKQLGLIEEQATPTLKSVFKSATTPKELSSALQHGFQDSLVKILSVLSMRIDGEKVSDLDEDTKESVFAYGCALQQCITDNLHNYCLMLPPKDDEQSEYKKVLSLYEQNMLPRLYRSLFKLPFEFGIESDRAKELRAQAGENCTAGKEHLHQIPAEKWDAPKRRRG